MKGRNGVELKSQYSVARLKQFVNSDTERSDTEDDNLSLYGGKRLEEVAIGKAEEVQVEHISSTPRC